MEYGALVLFAIAISILGFDTDGFVLSEFELKRRASRGNKRAKQSLIRQKYRRTTIALWRLLWALSIMLMILFTFGNWNLIFGVIYSLLIIFLAYQAQRLKPVRQLSIRLFGVVEQLVVWSFERLPLVAKIFTFNTQSDTDVSPIGSTDELKHLLTISKDELPKQQRLQLLNLVKFSEQTVGSIMIASANVATIDMNEALGPLMLDELYRQEQSVMPVVNGDSEKIVGWLSVRDKLKVVDGETPHVSEVMGRQVDTISIKAGLLEALDHMATAQQLALVVTDESGKTLGVVALHDILLGLTSDK